MGNIFLKQCVFNHTASTAGWKNLPTCTTKISKLHNDQFIELPLSPSKHKFQFIPRDDIVHRTVFMKIILYVFTLIMKILLITKYNKVEIGLVIYS